MADSKTKQWVHYSNDILALTEQNGVQLELFIYRSRLDNSIFKSFQLLDYNRYRIISKASKIAAFMRSHSEDMRFKFLYCNN